MNLVTVPETVAPMHAEQEDLLYSVHSLIFA